jgi:NADPH:quinone reductase-like Zn-dependent oxidoreductase
MMKAAVLHALGEAPSYEGFAEPTPNKDETLVSVRAASLKNSDKMMADGSGVAAAASRRQPSSRRFRGCGSWQPKANSASTPCLSPSPT